MPEPTILLTGLALGESPRWHDGRLWVCDWAAHELIALVLAGRRRRVIARVPTFPFCIDPLPDGHLLVVSGGDARIMRLEADGSLAPYADLSGVSRKPWNEIVVDGRGNAYVNTIGFDFVAGEAAAPGLIAVVTPRGRVREVAGDVAFPNGMAITPDGATLIVAETYAHRLTAYDIGEDAGLSNRRVWADLGDDAYPDGISLDAEGAVWYADVPNTHCVRVREGGEILQTIALDRGCFSCALGGPDGTTLFIAAARWNGPSDTGEGERTGLLAAVEVSVPSAARPG